MKNKIKNLFKLVIDSGNGSLGIYNARNDFNMEAKGIIDIPKSLNASFMLALADDDNGREYLEKMTSDNQFGQLANFYLDGIARIRREFEESMSEDFHLNVKIDLLIDYFEKNKQDSFKEEAVEIIWGIFFPEGVNIFNNEKNRVEQLRKKRTVSILQKNPSPIEDPGKEMIFTSNILLTVPHKNTRIDELPYSTNLKESLKSTIKESQVYWYDHPIQIGVKPEHNEILYGLDHLDKAVEYEKQHNNTGQDKLTVVLSASVTHYGLQSIAKDYIYEEIKSYGGFNNLDIYVFSECDTEQLITDVLIPGAEQCGITISKNNLLQIFGVDGEYGRHYSFLKAIVAFWNTLIDKDIRATFKIDLDQVFPEKTLARESGQSAFNHFKNDLWGALGKDSDGLDVELGMIAGALVNEGDIKNSLYTLDVNFPDSKLKPEDRIFFSGLPQALSTEAEMGTRYGAHMDGENRCLQRIHVTGGTNGILVESLRKHRPFTPSFIARAEDQCYILSVACEDGAKLAYLHADGLIMRHDKYAFAADAMKAASFGNLIGDYIRMLNFSEYAKFLTEDIKQLKAKMGPFTGAFISYIPVTVVLMRFALKAATLFQGSDSKVTVDFLLLGSKRLTKSFEFTHNTGKSRLITQCEEEKKAWDCFYDTLDGLAEKLALKDASCMKIKQDALKITEKNRI